MKEFEKRKLLFGNDDSKYSLVCNHRQIYIIYGSEENGDIYTLANFYSEEDYTSDRTKEHIYQRLKDLVNDRQWNKKIRFNTYMLIDINETVNECYSWSIKDYLTERIWLSQF